MAARHHREVGAGIRLGCGGDGPAVVARRSQRLSLPVELLRAIGCVVFPIGLVWVVVDRHRRSLQDIVFRTL